MNCLVIACSQRKRDPLMLPYHNYDDVDGTPISPAVAVYDGPLARIVRKHASYRHLSVWFLSAWFGLIQASYLIPLYDQKMTSQQAVDPEWIGIHVIVPWLLVGAAGFYENVYTCLPRRYEAVLAAGLGSLDIEPISLLSDDRRDQDYMSQALKAFCSDPGVCVPTSKSSQSAYGGVLVSAHIPYYA